MTEPFLRVEDLCMTFRNGKGELDVLHDINFEMREQEFLCVLGPSGSGKSTLLRLIAGLLKPSAGKVSYSCGDVSPQVGLVFQQANLMPWRTVRQNIALPLEIMGIDAAEIDRRVSEMIAMIGLEGFSESWPSQLSGGMAQRVAIARAFIQKPDLLLLDEPFGSLDALTRERMGGELLHIWQAQRTAVIMVTHSISEALLLSDRVLVFSQRPGSIVRDVAVGLMRPRKEELRYTREFQDLERNLRSTLQ